MTYHAIDGLKYRLGRAGLDDRLISELTASAFQWAALSPSKEVHAVRLAVLPATHDSGDSRGNTVWAICRDGTLLTVYLRKESQGPPKCHKYTLV